jgi:hypothetical protein
MPLPEREYKESTNDFMVRCMGNNTMNEEYKDAKQRYAVCLRASGADTFERVAKAHAYDTYGFVEELTEHNFYAPASDEYEDCEDEDEEEIDIAEAKPGLWENIRKKKEREGKDYKPAGPGDKDRPDPEAWKKAQNSEYQGRKVTLNKPFRTPGGPKKFAVYVKNGSGNVIIVRFGDPNMTIKKDNPERRKSFRARHRCDTAKDKTTPRYWSCKMW